MDSQNYISLNRSRGGGRGFPPRGRGARRGVPPRRPITPQLTPEERIRAMLIRACDKHVIGPNNEDEDAFDVHDDFRNESIPANIQSIANFIKRDTRTHTAQLPATLVECVKALPAKVPLYAALIAMLNEPEIATQVAQKVSDEIGTLSSGSDSRSLKLLLRFAVFLCRHGVLTVHSLCALLSSLLGFVTEYDGAKSDFYAYQLCMALAYAGYPLNRSEEGNNTVKKCMDALEKYFGMRAEDSTNVGKAWLSPWKEFSQERQKENDELTIAYNALKEGNWELHCGFMLKDDEISVTKSNAPSSEGGDDNAATTPVVKAIDLPQVTFQTLNDGVELPFSQTPFFLYEDGDEEESMHELTSLDAVVLRDLYVDVMTLFQGIPKEAVGCLVHIPTPETAPCALYEAVLGQLFTLPNPPARIVYYQLLLVYLCKVDKKYIAQFKESVNIIFESVDKLDMECVDRVTEWLSWHLSNFEYVWSWKLWAKQLHEDPSAVSPIKRNFVTDLLDKCIRLSSYDAIKAAIPEGLHEFLPAQPAQVPSPSTPECDELRKLFMENNAQGAMHFASEHSIDAVTVLKVLFSLLRDGKVVAFMNNMGIIKSAGDNNVEITKDHVLECLGECCPSLQDLSFAISMLVDAKIMPQISFVMWLFSDSNAQILCRSAAWDIARKLLDGMIAAEEGEEHNGGSSSGGMEVDSVESDVSVAVLHILRFIVESVNGEDMNEDGNKSYFCTTTGEHAIEFVRKYGKYLGSDASELVSQLSCIDERLSDYSN